MDQGRYKYNGQMMSMHEIVASFPREELSYIYGRYCGPSNKFLCMKKFGFELDSEMVARALADEQFEKVFLTPKSE